MDVRVVRYRRRPNLLCGTGDCPRRASHQVRVDGEVAARCCEWHAHVEAREWRRWSAPSPVGADERPEATMVPGTITVTPGGYVSGYLTGNPQENRP